MRVAQAYFDALLAGDSVTSRRRRRPRSVSSSRRPNAISKWAPRPSPTPTRPRPSTTNRGPGDRRAKRSRNQVSRAAIDHRARSQVAEPARTHAGTAHPEPALMDSWVERAEKAGYSVRIAEATLEIAKLEIDRNRAGHYPTLDLVASYNDTRSSASSQSSFGSNGQTGQISLQLAIPLYAGGALSSKVREAAANQEKSRQDTRSSAPRRHAFGTPGFPGCDQRHRPGQGPAAGPGFGRHRAVLVESRHGGWSTHQCRRAQCTATGVSGAA